MKEIYIEKTENCEDCCKNFPYKYFCNKCPLGYDGYRETKKETNKEVKDND